MRTSAPQENLHLGIAATILINLQAHVHVLAGMPAQHRQQQQKRRPPAASSPYSSPLARDWPADEGLDAMLLGLSRTLVESAPERTVSIAELGDQIAVRLKQRGIHPKRDGKIVRLSAYMRAVHDGWETFLAARAPEPLGVDRGMLCIRTAVAEKTGCLVPIMENSEPTSKSRPHVNVDELDLSRL